jgi:hypothetical protein
MNQAQRGDTSKERLRDTVLYGVRVLTDRVYFYERNRTSLPDCTRETEVHVIELSVCETQRERERDRQTDGHPNGFNDARYTGLYNDCNDAGFSTPQATTLRKFRKYIHFQPIRQSS